MSKVTCALCPHQCAIEENEIGFCRARGNRGGNIIAINYGLVTSVALDPIEKKPLQRFFPSSKILSVGSFGCNLRCSFCQNHEISMSGIKDALTKLNTQNISPDELIDMALSLKKQDNIGIAYTYNEPLVGYEYVRDCSILAKKKGLKNVLVTNGCFCKEPLEELLPNIDALNIDLKAFSESFYIKMHGDLETVKNAIKLASSYCHVEVTTLIIPGENDSKDEIRKLSQWLGSVGETIPLHLSRFFPCYKMLDHMPTDIVKLNELSKIASEYLQFVYVGNC